MSPEEIEKHFWEMDLNRLCGMIACRIVRQNKNIDLACDGFQVMIESISAFYQTDAQRIARAEKLRDLGDRVEHRVLQPVKVAP